MNTNTTISLPLDHVISTTDTVVSFGAVEDGETHIAFTSCELPLPPTKEELKSIGLLLLGGADWGDVNCVLLALADHKTGKWLAGQYRLARSTMLVNDWADPAPNWWVNYSTGKINHPCGLLTSWMAYRDKTWVITEWGETLKDIEAQSLLEGINKTYKNQIPIT